MANSMNIRNVLNILDVDPKALVQLENQQLVKKLQPAEVFHCRVAGCSNNGPKGFTQLGVRNRLEREQHGVDLSRNA